MITELAISFKLSHPLSFPILFFSLARWPRLSLQKKEFLPFLPPLQANVLIPNNNISKSDQILEKKKKKKKIFEKRGKEEKKRKT